MLTLFKKLTPFFPFSAASGRERALSLGAPGAAVRRPSFTPSAAAAAASTFAAAAASPGNLPPSYDNPRALQTQNSMQVLQNRGYLVKRGSMYQ